MITLTGQRRIGACQVYPDDVDNLTWYYMPDGPRIALDPSGKPSFSLVWYRRDVSQLSDEERKTRLGGGILAVTTELALTDDQMKEIRTTLAVDPALKDLLAARAGSSDPAKLAQALSLSLVPITDGTVTIAVLAESPDGSHPGEFVSSLVGVGGVSMTGDERAAFMAKLTQDGAVLLWNMLEKNLAAIRIGYDLTFNYRVNGLTMTAWCDARKAFSAIQTQWNHLTEDASFSDVTDGSTTTVSASHDQSSSATDVLSKLTTEGEFSGVTVTPEAGPDVVKPEEIAALTETGNKMISDFLAATFLQAKVGDGFTPDAEPTLNTQLAEYDGQPYGHDGIDRFNLKSWSDTMQANFYYHADQKAVVQAHLRPNDNIGNVLQGHDVKDLRAQVEIDAAWYKYLDVQVVCTANFDDDPVDLVKAHLEYHGRGAEGAVDSVKDFVFQKGSTPQRFSTYLASPDKSSYSYQYEVFYTGSNATYTVSGTSNETILVLDTDRLGILRVDVQLGLVDWTRIALVMVKMWYGGSGADGKETEFTLDAQHQTHRWSEVIAQPVTSPYTYQLTFVDKSEQRIVLDPVSSRAKQLIVNQPLQEQLEVAVVPAGSFGAGGLIQQVAVALRYSDPAHNYDASEVYTLTDSQSKVWAVPLMDKTLRTYQYRVTVFYADGVTREDDWQTTDKAVLPIGDPFGYRVQVLPYLLKNPPGLYQFGTLHMAFDDAPAKIHAEQDFEINDFSKPLVWRFRLGSPDRHAYSYQLTMFKADGEQVAAAPAQDSKEVLVLLPPA